MCLTHFHLRKYTFLPLLLSILILVLNLFRKIKIKIMIKREFYGWFICYGGSPPNLFLDDHQIYVWFFWNGLFINMAIIFLPQLDSRWLKILKKKKSAHSIFLVSKGAKRKQFILKNVWYRLFHLQCLWLGF